MGIDISLKGRLTSRVHRGGPKAAETLRNLAEQWWEDDLLEAQIFTESSEVQVVLLVHPLAEPVELIVQRSIIHAMARTSSVGPGFHERVCDFFSHLGAAAGIEWDPQPDQDETEFFVTGNREALEAAMFGWLGAVCRSIMEHAERPDEGRSWGLSMPMEPQFLAPGPVHTPTGPRTLEWLMAVAASPAGPEGRSFFSSWRGDRSAPELLARAIAHMWMDLYWTPPQSEDAQRIMERTADLLAEAYRSDPSLEYPWAEWAQILECLDRDDDALAPVVRKQAEGLTPTIGYRRHPVMTGDIPGGWSIVLPGRFETGMDEAGETWMATDGRSGIDVQSFGGASPEEPLDPLALLREDAPDAEVYAEWDDEDHRGAAVMVRDTQDGEELWSIRAWIVNGSFLAAPNISTPDDPNEPWILGALRSMRCRAAES